MSRTTKFLILALVALTLAACAPQAAADPKTITASDAGKTIEVQKGGTLLVALEGNATTGFNWWVADPAPAILKQEGDQQVTPVSNAVGAPGTIVLKFTALEAGQAPLKLAYQRSWEKGVAPEKTFEVTIVVK